MNDILKELCTETSCHGRRGENAGRKLQICALFQQNHEKLEGKLNAEGLDRLGRHDDNMFELCTLWEADVFVHALRLAARLAAECLSEKQNGTPCVVLRHTGWLLWSPFVVVGPAFGRSVNDREAPCGPSDKRIKAGEAFL